MSDESTAQPGVEPTDDTQKPSVEGQVQENGPDDETDAESEGDAEDPDAVEEQPEEIEFDFGGNKFRAPKTAIPEDIASELDKFSKGIWADYSRKSGDIKQRSDSLEAREKAVEKMQGLQGDVLNHYSRGLQVKNELEQLSKVDLNALWQSDPDQARRVSDTISHKQAEFNSIVNAVNRQEQELTQAQQAERARRADEGRKAVEGSIKGFNADDVVKYAVSQGIPEKDAGDWSLNPIVTRFAWKAMMYDRMQTKATQAAKPNPAPAQAIKSLPGKGSGKPAFDLIKDADKMSNEEWQRRRNAQIAKRQA